MIAVCIDKPASLEVVETVCLVEGWCAVPPFGAGRVRIEIGGAPVLAVFSRRPDVEAARRDEVVAGFRFHVDLEALCYARAIHDASLSIRFIAETGEAATTCLKISRDALRVCKASACGL